MIKEQKNPGIKRILVIIDTNNLGTYTNERLECKNYEYLEINKLLHDNIVNNFNFKMAKNVRIELAVPKIFFDELKNQQLRSFEGDRVKLKELLKKFSNFQRTQLKDVKVNYEKYLEDKIKRYIGKYNLIEIGYPDKNIFNKLIRKAIRREKPFYKNRYVDSGFKDAIAWESIISFSKSNSYDNYLFLTKDSDFNDSCLFKEFYDLTGKNVIIVKDIIELKTKLEEEIRGTDKINHVLKEIEKNLFQTLELTIKSNYVEIISGNGIHQVHSIREYKITDIKILDGKYEVYLNVYFIHESDYAIHARYGTFDKDYLNDEDLSPAEITMIFDQSYTLKQISSENLILNGQNFLRID